MTKDAVYGVCHQTQDGKFYMAGYYYGGCSRQFYDIGIITDQGCEVIETVQGFRQARARLEQIRQAQAQA